MLALMILAALHTDGAFLRDASGGAVILRGVNVTGDAKVPPFRPVGDPSLLDPLPRWGLNVIRLLFDWEAYEPQRGAYDQSYLDYYVGVVRAAGERGLYVIVDFHQDAFSRYSIGGCGEGFPSWTLPPTVTPATPDNGPSCADWSRRVVGDAGLDATWKAFYADTSGARSSFIAMTARVAGQLAAEPAVLGYDLLNEPGGDEKNGIGPLYQDEARAIRAVHPGAILFVGPSYLVSAGRQTQLPRPTFDDFVYAPHFYDPVIFLSGSWSGSDESPSFATMSGKAAEWDAPLFLGEWGAPPSTTDLAGYLAAMETQLDLALAGAAQWSYTPGWTEGRKDGWNQEDFSIVDGTSALRANFAPRPYARRIAGTPLSMSAGAQSLDVTWQHDPAAGATELFLPAAWFGGAVALSTDGSLHCKQDGELASCESSTPGMARVHAAPAPRCGLTGLELLAIALLSFYLKRDRAR